MAPVYGWHFSTGRLAYGDGRKVEAGVTHEVNAPVVLCLRGLHASRRAIDALKYAPGAIVARVRLDGVIKEDGGKCAATRRTYLWVADASAVLRLFTADVAEAELLLAGVKDPRSWTAIEAARAFAMGEIDVHDLRAAYAAANAAYAAANAARSAANAARSANAAYAAANAARSAAYAACAAAYAAYAAANAADAAAYARSEMNPALTDYLMSLAPAGFVDPEMQP